MSVGGRYWWVWLVLSSLGLGMGCGNSGSSGDSAAPVQPKPMEAPGQHLGQGCSDSSPCQDGLTCLTLKGAVHDTTACSKACTSDGECDSRTACGVGPDGSQMCLGFCNPGPENIACVDGRSTACEATDGTHCEQCGCAAADYCREGEGCFPMADLGGACDVDAGCTQKNCDKYLQVCRVPVGQACTADNCEACMSQGGWSYCSRECESSTDCNGGVCAGSVQFGRFCHLQCARYDRGACPEECAELGAPLGEPGPMFCPCESCTVAVAPRPLGARCKSDAECTSRRCFDGGIFDMRGFCSQPCEASADCGEGSVCADIPCAPNETESCGKWCSTICAAPAECVAGGYCHPLVSTEGEPVSACDLKLPAGETCTSASECQSGVCVEGRCTVGN